MSAAVTVPVWLTLALAIPVLGLGGFLVRRIALLERFSIPAPVVGGLLFAVAVLVAGGTGWTVRCETSTALKAWTWLVTAEPDWWSGPVKSANLPFLAAFFASVGLGSSWTLVRKTGRPVLFFLAAAIGLAVVQNLFAVAMAALLGISPLLGLMCGSMSLTGGHATTLGFAAEFERAGLAGAQTFGMAAATLGLVTGGLLAGPVGGALVRRHRLQAAVAAGPATGAMTGRVGEELRALATSPGRVLGHALLLALCVKAGAWLSFLLQRTGLVFPVFIGTLIAGAAVRLVLDRTRPAWFAPELADALAAVALAVFLATAMMTLNLRDLAQVAGPMLLILTGQIVVMTLFAWWVTFPLMGRDYEAAVMAGGHCGFGLGSTATAIAGMKALVETGGAAPRAFLIVPLVGGFLVDLGNAANLTAFISVFSPR